MYPTQLIAFQTTNVSTQPPPSTTPTAVPSAALRTDLLHLESCIVTSQAMAGSHQATAGSCGGREGSCTRHSTINNTSAVLEVSAAPSCL